MKRIILSLLILFAGCAYGGGRIGSLLEDPHYMQYRQNLDALEREYLDKKIGYAEYLERKQNLDEKYQKEVVEREKIIHDEGGE